VTLGAFAMLPKEAVSFAMPARQSLSLEQLGSHWTHFLKNSILGAFIKICREEFKFY
jgi:hypothetical protein